MCSTFLDTEAILSGSEEWKELEEKWGEPVDLETEDDHPPVKLQPVFSTLDLEKTTFDSAFLFNKEHKKVGRTLSKARVLDYNDFLQDLEEKNKTEQFYLINRQIISAASIEEICDKIDDIFKSVEELSTATSTVRKKNTFPEKVSCSISTDALSFDDTPTEKEKSDGDDMERYMDENLEKLSHFSNMTVDDVVDVTRESVTTLAKKFSSILRSPAVNCNPRRQGKCCNKFKELAEFWKSHAFNESDVGH